MRSPLLIVALGSVVASLVGCAAHAAVLRPRTSDAPLVALFDRPNIYVATQAPPWPAHEWVAFTDHTRELLSDAGATMLDEGEAGAVPPRSGDLVVRLALGTLQRTDQTLDVTASVRVFDAERVPVHITPGTDEQSVLIDTSRRSALATSEDQLTVEWDGSAPNVGVDRAAFEVAVGRRMAALFVARLLPQLMRAISLRSRSFDASAPAVDVGS